MRIHDDRLESDEVLFHEIDKGDVFEYNSGSKWQGPYMKTHPSDIHNVVRLTDGMLGLVQNSTVCRVLNASLTIRPPQAQKLLRKQT